MEPAREYTRKKSSHPCRGRLGATPLMSCCSCLDRPSCRRSRRLAGMLRLRSTLMSFQHHMASGQGFVSGLLFGCPCRTHDFGFFIVVLFLGGGIRYRAPCFDGANKGPCLSVHTGVQHQCVTRGHCSAATAKSGTVRSAGLPAESEWIGDGPSAPHSSHVFRRSSGSSCRGLFMGDSEGPSAPLICYVHRFTTIHPAADAAWKTKKTKSRPARDTSAKMIVQDGWSVPVVHSFMEFRLADTGICLATRSDAEEAMPELRSGGGLAVLTRKQIVAGSEDLVGRDRIRSQNISGPVNNVEALLGAAGRRSGHIQVFCAKRRSCGGRHFPCSDRFPQ